MGSLKNSGQQVNKIYIYVVARIPTDRAILRTRTEKIMVFESINGNTSLLLRSSYEQQNQNRECGTLLVLNHVRIPIGMME
jgi:hypothetical protein